MNKFQKDLATGQEYEKRSLLYLDYDTYKFIEGYFKEYDLEITKDGLKTTIEIKSDKQASLTGNLAIEYECNKKPSGISTTTADFWIYFIVYDRIIDGVNHSREECYKIPTDELRKLVKKCHKVSGGDGNRSRMYLLKKSVVQKFLTKPLDLINFKNKKNLDLYIKPTMSNQEAKTKDQKPLSFTQRLIEEFNTDKEYDYEEIKQVIESFSKVEYERKKANYKVFPFGKYKYKKVEDICKIDKQYVKWSMKQSFMDNYPELMEEMKKHI